MTNHILFYEPFSELEQLFGTVFGPSRLDSRPSKPQLDLHEDTQKNIVTATLELPGIKKEDVQLTVHNNILTVSAENKISSDREESGTWIARERHFGKLSRSLRLPLGIKEEDVKAGMADGILTISFPRSSPEQEPKKITIA